MVVARGEKCIFCEIIIHKQPAQIIHEDQNVSIFLDKKPLFPGHALLVPKKHYETILDLPHELNEVFFIKLKQLTYVIKEAMKADGIFVAMNNIVSQSVPHAHFHVVPRRCGDGLKGFFWPRTQYKVGEMEEVAQILKDTWKKVPNDY